MEGDEAHHRRLAPRSIHVDANENGGRVTHVDGVLDHPENHDHGDDEGERDLEAGQHARNR
jgi:hypothetical protein